MPTGICVIYGVIIAISIEIKTVRIFGIKISRIVRANEPSPLGIVVASIEVIKSCFAVEVISSIPYRISSGKVVGYAVNYTAITKGIICILNLAVAVCIIDCGNVTFSIPTCKRRSGVIN